MEKNYLVKCMSRLSLFLILIATQAAASNLTDTACDVLASSSPSQPVTAIQINPQDDQATHSTTEVCVPKTVAPFRTLSQDGWKKLSPLHQHKLSPKKEDVLTPVSTNKFGSQFSHLGDFEDDFVKDCRYLGHGDTVLVNADAYGRLSLKALRYNAHLRVIYNDMDPQNATSILAFRDTCLNPEEKADLPVILGDCVTLQDQASFKSLFPENHPQGQISLIFAANVAHFLSPSRLVAFLAQEYDLLKPGGTLRMLACDFTNSSPLNQTLTLGKIKKKISLLNHLEVSAIQGHFSNTFSNYLKGKGFLFYGYFDKRKLNASKTMNRSDKEILHDLFPGNTMQTITASILKTIADAMGYHLRETKTLALKRSGGFAEDENGDYLGVTFEKPHDAPHMDAAAYFRKSEAFQTLEKRAKEEESQIAVLLRDSKLQDKHPYLVPPQMKKKI
ncbi:MAG: hypothetical protein ACK5TR_00415 [Alphaproteobacteria bacterium]|jgi:predicted methyltransferase